MGLKHMNSSQRPPQFWVAGGETQDLKGESSSKTYYKSSWRDSKTPLDNSDLDVLPPRQK